MNKMVSAWLAVAPMDAKRLAAKADFNVFIFSSLWTPGSAGDHLQG
ncbi:MAG: hypothetical protein VYB46_02455 [Pseudomonadota bacterium]|nr:hypothetical protein [Pseudomonadota bacterium]